MEEVEVGDIVEFMNRVGKVIEITDKEWAIELENGEIMRMALWHYAIENVHVLERGLDEEAE